MTSKHHAYCSQLFFLFLRLLSRSFKRVNPISLHNLYLQNVFFFAFDVKINLLSSDALTDPETQIEREAQLIRDTMKNYIMYSLINHSCY